MIDMIDRCLMTDSCDRWSSDCFAGEMIDMIDRCLTLMTDSCDRWSSDCFAGEMIDRCQMTDRCANDCFTGEMIDKMTIMYNRQRQAVITNELVEIISGAAALK